MFIYEKDGDYINLDTLPNQDTSGDEYMSNESNECKRKGIIATFKDEPFPFFLIAAILTIAGFSMYGGCDKSDKPFLEYRIVYSNESRLNVRCLGNHSIGVEPNLFRGSATSLENQFYWYGQYKLRDSKDWINVICADKDNKIAVEKRMKLVIDDELLSAKSMNEVYNAYLIKEDAIQTDESFTVKQSQ